MIRSVVIDDEVQSRNTLKEYVHEYCPEVDLLAEAGSVAKGVETIKKYNPDLVFLDVELPDGTGFDILGKINDISFKVIFISAYDRYAVRAFKFSAVDYLLKPFQPEDLVQAVSKTRLIHEIVELKKRIEVLLLNRNSLKKIALPVVDGLEFVNIEDIVRCEADRNYTLMIMNNGKRFLTSKTLREYEEMLSPLNFCRVHHSHMINMSFIKKYVKGEGGTVIMEDNSEIEVARRRKEHFLSRFLK